MKLNKIVCLLPVPLIFHYITTHLVRLNIPCCIARKNCDNFVMHHSEIAESNIIIDLRSLLNMFLVMQHEYHNVNQH